MKNWDIFISYAHEDRDVVARPLATRLRELGLQVWFDEYELNLGDSITQGIDRGISRSTAGVLIISQSFFKKNFTKYELRGIVQRHVAGENKILPIWVDVTAEEVRSFSSPLADLVAADWGAGINSVVDKIVEALDIIPYQSLRDRSIPLEMLSLLAQRITRDLDSSFSERYPFPLIALAYQHNTTNMIFYRPFPSEADNPPIKGVTITQKLSFNDKGLKSMYQHFIYFDPTDRINGRWAAAHELGHCFLHWPKCSSEPIQPIVPEMSPDMDYEIGQFNAREEAEADWFASILMTRGEEGLLEELKDYEQ